MSVPGAEALGTKWEVLSKYQEALPCYVGDWALTQFAHKGCGVLSFEIFISHLDMDLGTLLSEQGVGPVDL